MAAPGRLADFDGAGDAWELRLVEDLPEVLPATIAEASLENARELRIADWPAAPARIRSCLGRARADELCDHRAIDVPDIGRPAFQEEYAEWRVVRDDAEAPVRFELTTELAGYWEILATHAPERAQQLISEFAGEVVPMSSIYGGHDPLGPGSSEDDRLAAFKSTMLEPPGPYGNGQRAITCLVRRDNALKALLGLVIAAATPLQVDNGDGSRRFPSGSEAIPHLSGGSAQDCRNSDPVVVERIVRLTTERRPVRLDDPIGIYITDVQHHDLLAPDGTPLPPEWIVLSRQGEPADDGLARHQRLTIRPPTDASFGLGDVRSARSGQRIRHGAQLAELVELGVYIRAGSQDTVGVQQTTIPANLHPQCAENPRCADERNKADRLDQAR